MTAFTVKEVRDNREFKTDHGEFVAYNITVEGPNGVVAAQRVTKKDSPAPSVGQVIDGELEPSKNPAFPPKLKPTPKGPGGGGFRPMDPETQARIVRQHSQKMALQLVALKVQTGELTAVPPVDALRAAIDFFYHDAQAAKP